jgi:hypothetical protein
MNAKTKIIFLLETLLTFALAISCNLPWQTAAPTSTLTQTPEMKKTATLPPTVSETPTPPVVITITITKTAIVGDLGWGTIHGRVTNAATGEPIVGARVACQHSSYTSTALCNSSVVTAEDGTYAFPESFFHDTDRVQLEVQAQGYTTQITNVNFFASPWLNANFALVPVETPQAVCTQPACGPYEALVCPQGNCMGGCGYICVTPAAICTPPVCAIGTSEVYYCPGGGCAGGCGTTCATFTPSP